jgi:aspartate racemase
MHRVADRVEAAARLPLLHIADATAEAVKDAGIERPLLLGTRYTMEQDFYRGRMQHRHGIDVMVPKTDEREEVHAIIYRELCLGVLHSSSRSRYLEIIQRASDRGADGVILGCTEIGLLVSASDFDLPVLDSTRIHAKKALEFALK